jgi:hypothetical protein
MGDLDLSFVRNQFAHYMAHQADLRKKDLLCCSAHGPADHVPALLSEVDRLRQREASLRALCIPADDYRADDPDSVEGGAALVRLNMNEPVDEHGQYTQPPVLAVPVSDVLRILDSQSPD